MTRRYIYITILGLISILATMAKPYCDIRKFSIIDGLAANSITDLKQASDHLMWFSTWNGLSYYDGYTFHTFRDEPDNIDLLSTNRIIQIEPTALNNIWCVTSDRQLYVYDTHLCQFLQIGKQLNEKFHINLHVKNIYPTKNGNIWVIADGSNYIIRTHGTNLETSPAECIKVGEQGLRSGNVWFVWADKKGREWILTDKGTTVYNHPFNTTIPFKWIREVNESIFLATDDGKLAVYDERNRLNMIPLPAGVTKINQLKNTGYQLLIATNLGLLIYYPHTYKTELINVQSPSQPMAEVRNIYTDDFGKVWVFTDGMGVTLVDPKTGEKQWLFADQPDPSDRTSSEKFFITQDENKTLWIVPNKGTFSYYDRKEGKLVPYLLRSNSSGNYRIPTISKYLLDNQNTLWIKGVHDLTQVAFKNHTYILNTLDVGEAEVRSVCNTPAGENWAGYTNGIIQICNEKYQKLGYLAPNGQIVHQQVPFCDSCIPTIFVDRKGRTWIGSKQNGLFLRDTSGRITHFQYDPKDRNSLPCNDIRDIMADRQGRIWIATFGGGLVLVQENAASKISFLSARNGLSWQMPKYSKVRHITCCPTGEILIGTVEGLVTYSDNFKSPASIKFFHTTYLSTDSTSLAANDVNFVLLHSSGQAYVATLGGTLQKLLTKNYLKNNLKTQFFKQINSNEGMVQSMSEDNDGNIWVIRESSVDKFNPKTGQIEVFGPNDFDYNMSFTEARPTHDPATNNITIGTPMGSLTFNPAMMKKSQYQPRIMFTSLQYNGEDRQIPILHTKKLVIPANKRNLTISFASLDYTRKYQMQYKYRIEGKTPPGEWISNGSRNYIGFNRITHGSYILKVKATNSYGVWSKYVAELPIEVRPTFWESIWGRIVMLLIILVIIGSIFYNYNKRQKQKLSHEMSVMKNNFFSDAAHRLRTPLTLIGGPIREVLSDEQSLSDKSKELLDIACRNTKEMLEMINGILRFDNDTNFITDSGLDEESLSKEERNSKVSSGQIDDQNVQEALENLLAEQASEQEELTESGEKPKPEQKTITLLVVEDNADLRKYLYNILCGTYNVLLANNGKAGLLTARKEMPDFILTDVTMPVMDGITMVHQIKQDSAIAHIPIIILSAKASVEDQLKGFEEGVDGYLTKPFSSTYLLGRIEAVINQRRAIQADVIKQLKEAGDKDAIAAYHLIPSIKETFKKKISLDGMSEEESDVQEFAFMSSQINDKTMEKIMKYVTDNISNPELKIDDIGNAVGMSRSVLYSKIKNSVGMSPIDFVRHIRLMKATELLQNTDETMTNIAYSVGFSDPKYFSKVFKKEMGVIPREFRERTQS